MKLNMKVRYGLRAVIEIAAASSIGLYQKEIAEKQKIPLKFLDTIIIGLRNFGIVKNVLGKRSGYVLARPIDQITIYDVYRAFEPEMSVVDCLCLPNSCEMNSGCIAEPFWSNLNTTIKNTLNNTTIKDLMDNNQTRIE